MARVPACEDSAAITARLRELDRQRQEARNYECPHSWEYLTGICTKCGTLRQSADNGVYA